MSRTTDFNKYAVTLSISDTINIFIIHVSKTAWNAAFYFSLNQRNDYAL